MMWALTRPRLRADYILLDEAQDTNPVLEEIFLAQDARRVCVGNPSQQIYEWRQAKDIRSGFPGMQMELTQSFRFGPAIAEVANHWLRAATSAMQLTGHAAEPSTLAEVDIPDAVLCRGNADAVAEVLHFLDQGVPVALVGGGKPLLNIAKAAIDLQAGRRTSHHDLRSSPPGAKCRSTPNRTPPPGRLSRRRVQRVSCFQRLWSARACSTVMRSEE
ncbi:UvrD-helicase domain-containing protein [Streptomyces griseoluteus]|uniref:UvrD-helicase domain-containing protein n=1 Tax=Streptomyces griseoluteus TaxID=29306 RepID=UPI003425958B